MYHRVWVSIRFWQNADSLSLLEVSPCGYERYRNECSLSSVQIVEASIINKFVCRDPSISEGYARLDEYQHLEYSTEFAIMEGLQEFTELQG